MSDLPITIRAVSDRLQDRELAFVRETTVKVRWPRRAGIAWEEWNAQHGPAVDQLLKRAETTVAIADGVVLGFLAHLTDKLSGNAVVMLYVKAAYRGERIGLRLLSGPFPRNVQYGHDIVLTGGPPIRAWMPTAPWGKWCDHHGIAWERARL